MSYRQMSDIVRNQQPVTLAPDATVQEACARMRARRVGAVLVTDVEGRLLGIFTGRDACCRVLAECKDAAKTTLGQVMTPNPTTMSPGKNAVDALRLMEVGGFRHLPVVEAGKVVGVVSRGDFKGTEIDRIDEETGLWERV